MPLKEYKSGTAFNGVVGRTFDQSSPAWPEPLRAKEGAPNVLFIILDDTGYGQLGCYGSPIETPNLDSLAANGLLYNNMHTTALCSPTRSCILTGRNHHSVASGVISEFATTNRSTWLASPRSLLVILVMMDISPSKMGSSQRYSCRKAITPTRSANGT